MSNINISSIKQTKEKELKTFSDIVYDKTFGVEAYAPFQDAVVAMNASAIVFQEALSKASTRDIEKVRIKNEAKAKLIQNFITIAKLIDIAWPDGDKDYLKEQAGFTLNKTPQRRVITYIEPPTSFEAYNLKQRGLIKVEWEKAEYAVTTAFETLQEDGTWKNGIYCNKEYMELSYPFGTRLVLRAMSVGPNMVKSRYTEPIEVMVS
jgi:hypothetical protein